MADRPLPYRSMSPTRAPAPVSWSTGDVAQTYYTKEELAALAASVGSGRIVFAVPEDMARLDDVRGKDEIIEGRIRSGVREFAGKHGLDPEAMGQRISSETTMQPRAIPFWDGDKKSTPSGIVLMLPRRDDAGAMEDIRARMSVAVPEQNIRIRDRQLLRDTGLFIAAHEAAHARQLMNNAGAFNAKPRLGGLGDMSEAYADQQGINFVRDNPKLFPYLNNSENLKSFIGLRAIAGSLSPTAMTTHPLIPFAVQTEGSQKLFPNNYEKYKPLLEQLGRKLAGQIAQNGVLPKDGKEYAAFMDWQFNGRGEHIYPSARQNAVSLLPHVAQAMRDLEGKSAFNGSPEMKRFAGYFLAGVKEFLPQYNFAASAKSQPVAPAIKP